MSHLSLKTHVSEDLITIFLPSGTCKVHKRVYPLRPIKSMVNTLECNLARYLDGLIKPHIPSKYSISSNVEFLSKLKEFKILL